MTVWDFTVTDGAAGWLPVLDDELSFTASIEPGADHKGQSMAEHITFPLGTSAHTGYCSNATRVHTPAHPKDTVGNDLKFFDQAGFNINAERTTATTVDEVLAATAKVYGLDYGAHGFLCPHTTVAGSMANARNVARSDPANNVWRYGAGIPIDEDYTTISDDWAYDGSPEDDDDPTPSGANDGDGFPRFDEYRCFKVQGAMERARPDIKHLFVYNPGGAYGLGRADIWEFEVHRINDDEQLGKVVNYYGANSQNTIRIIETDEIAPGDDPACPGTAGYTYMIATPKPAAQRIWIYRTTIGHWGLDPGGIVAHEIGHDLRCAHQTNYLDPPQDTQLRTDSIMRKNYIVDLDTHTLVADYPQVINNVDRAARDLVSEDELHPPF